MAEWSPRATATLSWAFPILALAMGAFFITRAVSSVVYVLVAAGALILASMIGVATSDSGNRFTTGLAAAAAIPVVFSGAYGVDTTGALACYGLGMAGVWVLRHFSGDRHEELLPVMLRRLGGYVAYVLVYSAMRVGVLTDLSGGWEDLIPFLAAVAAWLAVEVSLRAMLILGPRELSRAYLARALIQDLNVFVGLALTGALFGELFLALQWWALPIALLPYSFAHAAFRRFQETKVTYKQTIRALARIPEVSGLGVNGHADRTTALATSIAKELGLGPHEVDALEFAGLMHDIGRVSLNEPQILKMGFTDDDIARWSAEIIAESPYLDKVAMDVRRQYEPYRKPGQQEDPEVSMISRIIKVAAAYDWRIHLEGDTPLAALETLHAGAAYEYDPEVVASLRRLLQTRGILSQPVRV